MRLSMLFNVKVRQFFHRINSEPINMEATATRAAIGLHSMLSIIFLTTLIGQAVSSSGHSIVSSFCEQFPPASFQRPLCEEYRDLLCYLYTSEEPLRDFNHSCHHYFKHEKWNCSNIDRLPLSDVNTPPFLTLETKEAAFVHALASATITHSVAKWCANKNGSVTYCGCDKSLDYNALEDGERWKCSADINFAINFTKKLMNTKLHNASSQYRAFILHNSKVGQQVVKENMNRTCNCTGNATCPEGQTCEMMLPSMKDVVGKELKMKYRQSIQLKLPSDLSQGNQTEGELICFSDSMDYCKPNPEYHIDGIAGRECKMNISYASSSQHCSNLCCDHGAEEYEAKKLDTCNCKFVWCCKVECETCEKTMIKHRCKSKN